MDSCFKPLSSLVGRRNDQNCPINENKFRKHVLDVSQENIVLKGMRIVFSSNLWGLSYLIPMPHPSLIMNRYPISEIVFARCITIVRALNGLCACYSTNLSKFICFMNSQNGEIVRSVFYNEFDNSVIKVSVLPCDSYSRIRCFVHSLDDILIGNNNDCFEIFGNNTIQYPGFVEFDFLNAVSIVYTGLNNNYRIYSTKNYDKLYELLNKGISDIKISQTSIILLSISHKNKLIISFIDIKIGMLIGV